MKIIVGWIKMLIEIKCNQQECFWNGGEGFCNSKHVEIFVNFGTPNCQTFITNELAQQKLAKITKGMEGVG